jgi:hypothetical protein
LERKHEKDAKMQANDSHDSDPQPDICLGQPVPDKAFFTGKHFLEFVEGLEQGDDRLLVGPLAPGESCFIHTIWKTRLNAHDENTKKRALLLTVS